MRDDGAFAVADPNKKRIAKLVRQFGAAERGVRANAWRATERALEDMGANWSDVGNWIEGDDEPTGPNKYTEAEMQEYGQAMRAEGVEAGIKLGQARASNGGGNGQLHAAEGRRDGAVLSRSAQSVEGRRAARFRQRHLRYHAAGERPLAWAAGISRKHLHSDRREDLMLEPDRDQIEIFVDAIFRHAQAGVVSLRAFIEGSNDVFRKTPIRIISNNLKFLCDAVEDDARRAAQNPKPVVFCPPLATFGNDNSAAEKDIAEGFTVTVECDERPEAARAKLEAILGPATTVIRSGGVWNDGNGGTQDKLHLHWRLAKPARGRDDLVKLKRVREICARLVGADPTSIPICHPIRWPGSWHRKNQPRLTEIVACNPDVEIELADALAKLEPLAPAPPRTNNRAAQPGGEWDTLTSNILAGKNLHASIARLAMKMLRGGTPEVMAVQMLRGLMDASQAPRDDRWRDRYDDIPRAVSSAGRKARSGAGGGGTAAASRGGRDRSASASTSIRHRRHRQAQGRRRPLRRGRHRARRSRTRSKYFGNGCCSTTTPRCSPCSAPSPPTNCPAMRSGSE